MNFTAVSGRDELIAVWPVVAPILIRAIRIYGEYTLEEVFEDLIARKKQLWVGGKTSITAVLITEIFNQDNGQRFCHVSLCAGDGAIDCIPHLETVEKWAKESGCNRIEIAGRRGWAKLLKDYKVKKITLKKDLS